MDGWETETHRMKWTCLKSHCTSVPKPRLGPSTHLAKANTLAARAHHLPLSWALVLSLEPALTA